jgi:tetratricopeptide (TPR) repeat protein
LRETNVRPPRNAFPGRRRQAESLSLALRLVSLSPRRWGKKSMRVLEGSGAGAQRQSRSMGSRATKGRRPHKAVCLLLVAHLAQSSGAGDNPQDGCEQRGFDAAMSRAVRLVRAQDHRSALPCLEVAHAERRDNVMAALYLGEALLRTGELERAASALEHVLVLDAGNVMAHLLLATLWQQTGKPEVAVEEFRRVIQLDPSNVAALVNSGTTLRALGREDEALQAFEGAVRVSPATPEAHYNAADVLLQRGAVKKALRFARTAANLRPAFPQAHVLKILAHEHMQQYQAAHKAAEDGLASNPTHYSLMYQLARTLRATAQFEAAEATFRTCTGALSRSFDGVTPAYVAYAYNELGHMLTTLGREEEAAAQWRGSVEVDPTFARGWVNLAGGAGLEGSLDAYQRALALEPSLVEAWINIGQVGQRVPGVAICVQRVATCCS